MAVVRVSHEYEPGATVEDAVRLGGVTLAARWAGIHQRMLIDDAQRITDLTERIAELERQQERRLVNRIRRWLT